MRKKTNAPEIAGLNASNLTTGAPGEQIEKPIVSDITQSYIGSSVEYGFLQTDRALPQTIDDAERDFGDDLYDRMANDAVLGGAEAFLKILTLAVDINVAPSIEEPRKETATRKDLSDFAAAKEMSDFGQALLDGLTQTDRPLKKILWEMLDAMRKGHRLAELNARIATEGPYAGKIVLDSIKPKPRKNYAFALDEYNTFRAVIAVVPGVSIALRNGIVYGLDQIPNAIAPEKLWVLTIGSKDGDPRGQSWFRRAYDPWYRKQIVKPESVKTAVQFGGGMITAELPENAQQMQVQHPVTGQLVHIQVAVQWALDQLKNGGTATFPAGAKVTVHRPDGDGKYFEAFFDRCDREMIMTFLLSARAMLEARHGSKADSEAAQDVVDDLVQWVRGELCDGLAMIIRRFIVLNWGEIRAQKYAPRVTMQLTSRPDFAANATAVAALATAQWFDPSQKDAVDRDVLGIAEAVPNSTLDPEDPASAGTFLPDQDPTQTTGPANPLANNNVSKPPTNRRGLQAIDAGRSAAAGKAKQGPGGGKGNAGGMGGQVRPGTPAGARSGT